MENEMDRTCNMHKLRDSSKNRSEKLTQTSLHRPWWWWKDDIEMEFRKSQRVSDLDSSGNEWCHHYASSFSSYIFRLLTIIVDVLMLKFGTTVCCFTFSVQIFSSIFPSSLFFPLVCVARTHLTTVHAAYHSHTSVGFQYLS